MIVGNRPPEASPQPDRLPGDEYLIPPLVEASSCVRCGGPPRPHRKRYDPTWGLVKLVCSGCGVERPAAGPF